MIFIIQRGQKWITLYANIHAFDQTRQFWSDTDYSDEEQWLQREKKRSIPSKFCSRNQRRIKKNAMQQVWKKDFTSNEKCPCTCTEKNGFERLDSIIFEFYIFFIIKSHNFSSKLRGTWNLNIITKVRSYLFWRYSLKNDWLNFFLKM